MVGRHTLMDTLTTWRTQKHKPPHNKKSQRKVNKGRGRDKTMLEEEEEEEDSGSPGDTLEILTPSLSDLQFKYNWNIKGFVDKVRTIRRN